MRSLWRTLLAGLSALLLLGCVWETSPPTPVSGASLVISDAERTSRTLLPAIPVGARYLVKLEQMDGNNTPLTAVNLSLENLSRPITDINSGPFRLSVEVKSADGTLLASAGPLDIQIDPSKPTMVGILLVPAVSGTGDLSLTLSWPATSFDGLNYSLIALPSGLEQAALPLAAAAAASGKTTWNLTALPGGSYRLQATATGGGVVVSRTEVVQIWAGLVTEASWVLDPKTLLAPPAAPSDVQFVQDGTKITIRWRDNSDNETEFRLYDNGVYQDMTGAGVNLYSNINGEFGQVIRGSVRAFNSAGLSAASAEVVFHYTAQVAQPVALAWLAGSTQLAVASSTPGNIQVYSTPTAIPIFSYPFGGPTAVTGTSGADLYFASATALARWDGTETPIGTASGITFDGTFGTAGFNSIQALSMGPGGVVFALDATAASPIRVVTTVGSMGIFPGMSVGTLVTSPGYTFNSPKGLVWQGAFTRDLTPYPANDFLYVADTGNNVIVKLLWNASMGTGTVDTVWGTPGDLLGPTGLAVDNQGYLYVADTGHNRVVRIDTLNGTMVVPTLDPAIGALSSPRQIVAGVPGVFYIADTGNNRIVQVTP